MKTLKFVFVATDIGFIGYWAATFCRLLPPEYIYSGYLNPIVVAWNWSFLPLDILIFATGFVSMYLFTRQWGVWRLLAFLALILTTCSGSRALSFWSIRHESNWQWWGVNAYLFLYPLFLLPRFIIGPHERVLIKEDL